MSTKIQKILTCLGKRIIILALASTLGAGLLTVVYLLPVNNMFSHVKESSKLISKEGIYPSKWGDEIGSTLDNFTDALMIQNAIYPVLGSPLKNALLANHMQFGNEMKPVSDLEQQIKSGDGFGVEYARYWHGYLLFLKPLLLIMNYAQIRILNAILQILLFSFLIWTMIKRGLRLYILPLIVSWLGIAPWVLPYSMQLSTVYYLALIGSILLIRYFNIISRHKYVYFMLLGICTSYFDYLTWPIITLGLPLVFFMLMETNEDSKTLKSTFKTIIGLCFNWGIGYAGMWGLKWCITELILNNGAISMALGAAQYRSSNEAEGIIVTCTYLWRSIIGRLKNLAFIGGSVLYIIYLLFCGVQHTLKQKTCAYHILTAIPYLFIAMLPLIWYAITKNHSYVHLSLVYRGLWTSIFAGFCWFTQFCHMRTSTNK